MSDLTKNNRYWEGKELGITYEIGDDCGKPENGPRFDANFYDEEQALIVDIHIPHQFTIKEAHEAAIRAIREYRGEN